MRSDARLVTEANDLRGMLQEPAPFAKPQEILPGLSWVRLALPLRLDHVNVWLMDDADGMSVIDCGPGTDANRMFWTKLGGNLFAQKPLRRLIATHSHVDHVGLSGWFVEKFDVQVVMTLSESLMARHRHVVLSADAAIAAFMDAHGCPQEIVELSRMARHASLRLLGAQPLSILRLRDGDEIRISERSWEVIVTGGHADEHAALYCAADGLLIAGDEILPHITPAIGVYYDQPEADPLRDYFEALDRFEKLPDDVLVLPSHGRPFRGLHARIDGLRAHHAARLAQVEAMLTQEITAFEVARILFPRAYDTEHAWLALAEALAHLHWLRTEGRATRIIDERNRYRFSAR